VVVEVGGPLRPLAHALEARGLECRLLDGHLEVVTTDDADLDIIRDAVADLELPLVRLATRLTSLDEVFVGRAGVGHRP